jgi:hypothetical protein
LSADDNLHSELADAGESPPADPAGPPQPRARSLFRQGAIYGLAGAMKAADVAVAAARGAVRGAREGVSTPENGNAPPPDARPEPPANSA